MTIALFTPGAALALGRLSAKKMVIDTDRQKVQLFKVSESSPKFYIYHVNVGFISDSVKKIGEARNLQDAIEIIKASVDGRVRNIKIADW